MTAPWRSAFTAYFDPYQAGPDGAPGALVRQAMVGASFSSLANAHYAPFAPTGTAGQLAIGGTNVTASAFVSGMYRADYQGLQSLSAAPRTNAALYSTLAGTGTTPTGWSYYVDTGTSAPSSSIFGSADGAQAWTLTSTVGQSFFYNNFTVSANTVYTVSINVEAVTGAITAQNALLPTSLPVGASIAFPVCAANPAGGQFGVVQVGVLAVTLTIAGTGGTVELMVGVGCAASNVGSMTFSRPQVEAGLARTLYIPTTAAAASITDYSVTSAGVVTLGQTASGTYIWSGSGVLASGGSTNTLSCPTPVSILTSTSAPVLSSTCMVPSAIAATITTLAAAILLTLACPSPTALATATPAPSISLAVTTTLGCPAPAAIASTVYAPTIATTLTCPAPTGVASTGQAAKLSVTLAAPTPTAVASTGYAAGLSLGIPCPSPGALATSGQTSTLSVALGVPAPVSIATTGQQARLSSTLSAPGPTSVVTTTYTPTLVQNITTTLACPTPAAMTSGASPSSLTTTLAPTATSMAVSGQAGFIAVTCGAPAPVSIGFSTYAPTLVQNVTTTLLCPAPIVLTSTPYAPALARTLVEANTSMITSGQTIALSVTLGAQTPTALATVTYAPTLIQNITNTLSCPAPVALASTSYMPTLATVIGCPAPTALSFTAYAPTLGGTIILSCPAPVSMTMTGLTAVLARGLPCPIPSALATGALAPSLTRVYGPPAAVATTSTNAPALALALRPLAGAATTATFAPSIIIQLHLPIDPNYFLVAPARVRACAPAHRIRYIFKSTVVRGSVGMLRARYIVKSTRKRIGVAK